MSKLTSCWCWYHSVDVSWISQWHNLTFNIVFKKIFFYFKEFEAKQLFDWYNLFFLLSLDMNLFGFRKLLVLPEAVWLYHFCYVSNWKIFTFNKFSINLKNYFSKNWLQNLIIILIMLLFYLRHNFNIYIYIYIYINIISLLLLFNCKIIKTYKLYYT